MNTIEKGLVLLALGMILVGGATAIDEWSNMQIWNAQLLSWPYTDTELFTSMDSSIILDEDGISKDVVTNLFAIGGRQVKLESWSSLTTFDGGHESSVRNGITQVYYLPQNVPLIMSNEESVTGFPNDPTSTLSSSASLIDPDTGETLFTFSSSMEDDEVTALVNAALKEMGFTRWTLDDFTDLEGRVIYDKEHTDTDGEITAAWGETKNQPVKMDKG